MSEADRPIDDEIARISQRIRTWRAEAGLTLQELADRSKLATSTVQKVETGQMTPSVAVLLKVARGLGRSAAEFIHEAEFEIDALHLREGERTRLELDGGVCFERLSADLHEPRLEMWRVELPTGFDSGPLPIRYEGEALVVCEKGRPSFVVATTEHTLSPGDSLHFKAILGQRWRNDGRSSARFTLTGTLPGELRGLIQERVSTLRAKQRR
jgi:transcriptional regulator with XRE-family HTH domain